MILRSRHRKHHADDRGEGFVSDYLLYLLAAASDVTSADFHAHIRARGVRVPEWRILACLRDEDGMMVTQLAQLALMEQSRLTKTIDQMAQKGLVARRSDRRDRRRVRVFLSDAGRQFANELVADARAHEHALIEKLNPGEVNILKEGLKRIKTHYAQAEIPGERQGNEAAA